LYIPVIETGSTHQYGLSNGVFFHTWVAVDSERSQRDVSIEFAASVKSSLILPTYEVSRLKAGGKRQSAEADTGTRPGSLTEGPFGHQ